MVEWEGYLCYRKWKRIDHLVDESLSPMEAGVALEGLMAPTFYQLPVEAQAAVTSAARLAFQHGVSFAKLPRKIGDAAYQRVVDS